MQLVRMSSITYIEARERAIQLKKIGVVLAVVVLGFERSLCIINSILSVINVDYYRISHGTVSEIT